MKFIFECALRGLRDELKEEINKIDIHMEIDKHGVVNKATEKIDLLFYKILKDG